MKILVINTGSSSIKYKLFDVDRRRKMSAGVAEKIGEKTSLLTHRVFGDDGTVRETTKKGRIADHREGMEAIVELLVDPEAGAIGDKAEITAVGHRVVHGGETFRQPAIIDDEVVAAIREKIPLAPLHNPPNLTGITIAREIFPAGFYRRKAAQIRGISRQLVERHGGRVPGTIDELLELPGVGRKTANLVVTLGFRKPGICVDIHVHRITNRLGWVRTTHPDRTEERLREVLPRRHWIPINEILVRHGQQTCRPISPICSACPVSPDCPKRSVTRRR